MRIAVISDLHLNRKNSTNRFSHKEKKFLKFLDYLEDNFHLIVLNGDIFECQMPNKFGDVRNELYRAINANKKIYSRFKTSKYMYIHGNHDEVAKPELGAMTEYTVKIDDKKMIFIHGHQFDFFVHQYPETVENIVWASGWLIRAGGKSLYNALTGLEVAYRDPGDKLTHFHRKTLKGCPDEDIIVTGHTHQLRKAQLGNKLYLNSGTCIDGNINYIAIDTFNDIYETKTSF